jgi:hypothetical protein
MVNEDALQLLLNEEDSVTVAQRDLVEDSVSSAASPEAPKPPQVQYIATPIQAAEDDSLSRILATKKQIIDVKQSLSSIVDSIADNPSLFTRASGVWGGWPIWQKIGSGLVLTAPPVLVGIFANIGALIVIGSATGVIYSATGMVLEDHHACNISIKQRLKDGILCIADILELTIVALDAIRDRLAEEVKKFNEENATLARHVKDLGEQVSTLTNQVEVFIETERLLRVSKEKLEVSTKELQTSVDEHSHLLELNRKELVEVSRAYEQNQASLIAQVAELTKARELMSLEVTKAKKISEGLKKAVDTLSFAVSQDQTQRTSFQDKLERFLTGKQESFDKVTSSLETTEDSLQVAQKALNESNDRYARLLDMQEALVARLMVIDNQLATAKMSGFSGKLEQQVPSSVRGHSLFAGLKTGVPVQAESIATNNLMV